MIQIKRIETAEGGLRTYEIDLNGKKVANFPYRKQENLAMRLRRAANSVDESYKWKGKSE